ncbi:MerR family transcriptional regulator, partial [Candidatus Saccharibacteria bacterium]|nr:MerR family transcriptional regulator [Candidatus Saccharibacteria bacterium]
MENNLLVPRKIEGPEKLIPVSEVERRSGVSYNTLRYYTKIGLLPHMTRKLPHPGAPSTVGHYPVSVLETLEKIAEFKKQGLDNETIKKELQTAQVSPSAAPPPEETPSIPPVQPSPPATPPPSPPPPIDLIPLLHEGRKQNDLLGQISHFLTNMIHEPLPKRVPLWSKVTSHTLTLVLVFGALLILSLGFSDLTHARIKRIFSGFWNQYVERILPGNALGIQQIDIPIVDVNDVLEYRTGSVRLVSKFPFDVDTVFAKTINAFENAVFNTGRFLGTVFFGTTDEYFISPMGVASLKDLHAVSVTTTSLGASNAEVGEVTAESINVKNLTVSGSTVGAGGGPAAGGNADTLEGQSGNYYLNWVNFTNKPIILSSLEGVSNNEGNIDLLAGSNIIITPDDTANTITIASTAGSDADTLDGLDSLQFMRSDTSDSFTSGTLTIAGGTTLDVLGTFTCTDCLNDTHITDIYLFNSGDVATGNYTFEDDVTLGLTSADTLIVNALVSSNIIPIDNTRDLGSAGLRWSNVFADEVNATTIVGTISGGETTSSDWRINSDNDTNDLQDSTITFDRGLASPNGVLRWDSTNDRYRFETFPVYLDDSLTVASNGISVTGNSSFSSGTITTNATTTLDINGNLAWGGATVTENLDMATNIIENIGNSGTDFDTNGGLTLAGDLTINGGELFLTGIVSSSSTTEGTIYFDSDNSRLYVYQSGAFQEITTGLSKYTASNAALANQGYIEIAHNQATNDLALTAWYYDSVLGQWRTVDSFTKTINLDLASEFNPLFTQKLKTSSIKLQYKEDSVGTGADGAITVSSNTDINATNLISGRSCTPDGGDAVNYNVTALTATSATLSTTPSAGCLNVGDEVLLINLQGTNTAFGNTGNWETLRIQSISSNVVTFTASKTKYYGNGASDDTNLGTAQGTQRVMLQRVPNYTTVTVDATYNFYPSAWNGSKGGVMFFRTTGAVSINGTIHANAVGYRGGAGGVASGAQPNGGGGNGGEAFCGIGGNGASGAGAGGDGAAGGGAGYESSAYDGGDG